MPHEPSNAGLEQELYDVLGAPEKPDFASLRSRHADAIACLNPTVTAARRRRQSVLRWTVRGVVAAGLCAFAIWMIPSSSPSFAQAIRSLEKARTATWTQTGYDRVTSFDKQRTWLHAHRLDLAYLAPSSYRTTSFDDQGKVDWIEISDSSTRKTLRLEMKTRKAIFGAEARMQIVPFKGAPFDHVRKALQTEPLELVGQRVVNGRPANVFRTHPRYRMEQRPSRDYWIDVQTRQFVGESSPGGDKFDPFTMPERNNPPEPKFSKVEILGMITDNIVLDSELSSELFSMTPPPGFELIEVKPSPPVTEVEMVNWLGASARVNRNTFPDTAMGLGFSLFNTLNLKKRAELTPAEKEFVELELMHQRHRHRYPLLDFVQENSDDKSFRYIGKGAKLGTPDRIICWYRLKSTSRWRAIYADLSVKDVEPKDLPRPVGETQK